MKGNIGKLCKLAEHSPIYKIDAYSEVTKQYFLILHSMPTSDCLVIGWRDAAECLLIG